MTRLCLCFEEISLGEVGEQMGVARVHVGRSLRKFFKIIWMRNDGGLEERELGGQIDRSWCRIECGM